MFVGNEIIVSVDLIKILSGEHGHATPKYTVLVLCMTHHIHNTTSGPSTSLIRTLLSLCLYKTKQTLFLFSHPSIHPLISF